MKIRTLALSAAIVLGPTSSAFAATQYEWDLSGNTSAKLGTGSLAILSGTPATSYPTTNLGGQTSGYLSVPKMTSNTNEGLTATLPSSAPNGGSSSYINEYTLVMDVYVPTPASGSYTALFQTQPTNASGNDADLYVYNSNGQGEIGDSSSIGGYSAAGAFTFNAWHRVALSVDLQNNTVTEYVDGTAVYTDTSTTLLTLDGRMSLYSNLQTGPSFLLFNEGDSTAGTYTNALDVSAIGFTDTALSSSQIAALGGFNAAGIFAVPEPTSVYLGFLAAGAFLIGRRLRRNA